jgi:hypothetical protein
MGVHPMKKFVIATLALLVLVLTGPFPAPASAMPAVIQKDLQSGTASPLLTQVHRRNHHHHYNNRWRGDYWRYPRYGYGGYWRPRYYAPCYGWGGYGCRRGYGGYYGGSWLGYGPTIVYRNRGYGYGSRHVRWCLNRYRSYNPRSNTWVAYSGRVRQCISPYGP